MTLEGEYYFANLYPIGAFSPVAILMTLEGEYYTKSSTSGLALRKSQSS